MDSRQLSVWIIETPQVRLMISPRGCDMNNDWWWQWYIPSPMWRWLWPGNIRRMRRVAVLSDVRQSLFMARVSHIAIRDVLPNSEASLHCFENIAIKSLSPPVCYIGPVGRVVVISLSLDLARWASAFINSGASASPPPQSSLAAGQPMMNIQCSAALNELPVQFFYSWWPLADHSKRSHRYKLCRLYWLHL